MPNGPSNPRHRALVSAAAVFHVIRIERYTGPVIVHCQDGVPKSVEYGRPRRIEIYESAENHTEGLDNPTAVVAHSTTMNT